MSSIPEESTLLNAEPSNLRSRFMDGTLKFDKFVSSKGSGSTGLGNGTTSSTVPI